MISSLEACSADDRGSIFFFIIYFGISHVLGMAWYTSTHTNTNGLWMNRPPPPIVQNYGDNYTCDGGVLSS